MLWTHARVEEVATCSTFAFHPNCRRFDQRQVCRERIDWRDPQADVARSDIRAGHVKNI